MIRLYMINFGWFARNGQTYETLDQALKEAKEIGFEVSMINAQGESIGSWSPIGGFRSLT
jgi:multimeric flavodoxin WrbA